MKLTGGEIVVHALEAEGITHTFGIPGTHNIELYDALGPSRITPVLITDEQSAGFMADGFWRASGRMACLNLVPGAGFTHALSGIAEAFMDCVPMLVLGCGIRQDLRMAYQLHDIDQLSMARPVTKATFQPLTGAELYPMIREACALARAGTPGPVMVEVPVNLYLTRHDVDTATFKAAAAPATPRATDEEIARVAQWLTAPGTTPLLYAGLGAARADLVALAERLEAPAATTIQGKGVFPESHPLFLWNGFGNTAPPALRAVAAGCDRVLAIGCRFGEVGTGGYGITLPGPLCHVDINPEVLGRNFPAEIAVSSDAADFVTRLCAALGPRREERADLRRRIAAGHAEVGRAWVAGRAEGRVSPALLLQQLQRRFGDDAIYATDSGNGTFLAMETLRLERGGRFLAPVDYSCMGYAVPAAIGAKLACPSAPVIALAGDGAFLMTGLEGLTAVQRHLPVLIVLLRDRALAQIAQFQETAFNRAVASDLPDYDAGGLARGMGMDYIPLGDDRGIEAALTAAAALLAEGKPVLLDAAVDYGLKTWFTRGVVTTMLGRLPWKDRLRFVGRALVRQVTG